MLYDQLYLRPILSVFSKLFCWDLKAANGRLSGGAFKIFWLCGSDALHIKFSCQRGSVFSGPFILVTIERQKIWIFLKRDNDFCS
jgi:hypothetical protein